MSSLVHERGGSVAHNNASSTDLGSQGFDPMPTTLSYAFYRHTNAPVVASSASKRPISVSDSDGDSDSRYAKQHRAEVEPSAAAPAAKTKPTTKMPPSGQVWPAPRKRKGQRLGRLEAVLQEMPVEILGEILAQLTPNMLLRLARMAKVFRRLLMARSSRSIWLRAFANDGITNLHLPDMCEPKLASLIWDKECVMCGRLKVHKICYGLWTRLCDPCLKDHLRTPGLLRSEIEPSLLEGVLDCVPYIDRPPCRGGHWHHFQGQDLKLYVQPAVKLENDKLQMMSTESGENGELSERARYIEERKAALALMAQDAKTLQTWQSEIDSSRVCNKQQLRRERFEAIRRKCLDEGFEERDIDRAFEKDSAVHTEVDQPYALTDRVWRKIRKPIFATLEQIRDDRLHGLKRRNDAETLRRLQDEQMLRMSSTMIRAGSAGDGGGSALVNGGEGHHTATQQALSSLGYDESAMTSGHPRNLVALVDNRAPWVQMRQNGIAAPGGHVAALSDTGGSSNSLDVLSTISAMLSDGSRSIAFPAPQPMHRASPNVSVAPNGLSGFLPPNGPTMNAMMRAFDHSQLAGPNAVMVAPNARVPAHPRVPNSAATGSHQYMATWPSGWQMRG
ncbi:hypothetical protein OIO90_002883 [Microbotryomycetes sp. JL221]|nr:hypothetical protein OIO90_002883 [Microbotryomycetes sp. JL221]